QSLRENVRHAVVGGLAVLRVPLPRLAADFRIGESVSANLNVSDLAPVHFGSQFPSSPHRQSRVIFYRPRFELHIRRTEGPSCRRQRLEFEWPGDQIPQAVFTFEWTVRPRHPFARE